MYGYERNTAPTLKRLAASSAVLEGLAPSSWTKPSTASILTGLHPIRHQALSHRDMLPSDSATIAEILKASGYKTVGVSANTFVSADFNFDQGFDSLDLTQSDREGDNVDAHLVNQAVDKRLAGLKPPYFLYVHYTDPHQPYRPKVDFSGRQTTDPGIALDELYPSVACERDPQLLQRTVDLYDGEIRQVDGAIEALLANLESRGLP